MGRLVIRARCTTHKPYRRGAFDFLAVYLVLEDVWYILPAKETFGKWSVSLGSDCNRSRYEQYLEAWDLLRRPEFNGEIKARAEELPVLCDDACQVGRVLEFTHPLDSQPMFSGD
jgi:hypothetical protein